MREGTDQIVFPVLIKRICSVTRKIETLKRPFRRENVLWQIPETIPERIPTARRNSRTCHLSDMKHPGIEAVYILRSRVALYMQDWETAKTYAQKAIDKDGYLLNLQSVPSASYPLNKQNAEVVFSNGASMLGNILFVNPGDKHSYSEVSPSWYLSDNLYALFSDDDYRKTTYITTDDDLTNSLPTYHKVDCSIASYGKYKEVSDVFSIRTA